MPLPILRAALDAAAAAASAATPVPPGTPGPWVPLVLHMAGPSAQDQEEGAQRALRGPGRRTAPLADVGRGLGAALRRPLARLGHRQGRALRGPGDKRARRLSRTASRPGVAGRWFRLEASQGAPALHLSGAASAQAVPRPGEADAARLLLAVRYVALEAGGGLEAERRALGGAAVAASAQVGSRVRSRRPCVRPRAQGPVPARNAADGRATEPRSAGSGRCGRRSQWVGECRAGHAPRGRPARPCACRAAGAGLAMALRPRPRAAQPRGRRREGGRGPGAVCGRVHAPT